MNNHRVLTALFIALLSLGCQRLHAATPATYVPNSFALDITAGTSIDLSALNWEQKLFFEGRPDAAARLSLRPSYFGKGHWGGYADLSINFFKFDDSEKLFDVLMPGLGRIKPSLTVGAAYRFESQKWQIHPRLGVGFLCYGSHSTSKTETNEAGIEETVRSKLSGNMFGLDTGISAAYRISRICSLVLDVNFFQPIESGRVTRSIYEGDQDVPRESIKIKSTTWGRSMNISIGIRFQRSAR